MSEELFLPTVEELEAQKGDYSSDPLEADDYVAKIAKIKLGMKPSWNNATKRYDWPEKLKYELILLPYKPKAEDKMVDIKSNEVEPLRRWIFKEINPFALGMQQSGEMSYMRALLSYGQPAWEGGVIKMPWIVVLTKDDKPVPKELAQEYKENLIKLQKKEIEPSDFKLRQEWYKHVVDVRPLEWNYVGIKLTVDEKGRQKMTSFWKVPSAFVADSTVEKEAMEKFAEGYAKMLEKRGQAPEKKAEDIKEEETVQVADTDLPL